MFRIAFGQPGKYYYPEVSGRLRSGTMFLCCIVWKSYK